MGPCYGRPRSRTGAAPRAGCRRGVRHGVVPVVLPAWTVASPSPWSSAGTSAGRHCGRRARDRRRAGQAARRSNSSACRRGTAGPPRPVVPPVPVRRLPLAARLLYEAWRRLGRPAVERATGPSTWCTPPPSSSRRPGPLVVTIHDLAFLHEPASLHPPRRARLHRPASSASPRRAPTWCCAPRRPRWTTARRTASSRPPAPGAPRARPGRRPTPRPWRRSGARSASADRTCCSSARSSPARTCPACSRLSPAPGDHELVVAGPAGWGDGDSCPRDGSSRVRLAGLRARGHEGRALRRRRRRRATRACGRASGCPCSKPWPRAPRS